MPPSKCSVLTRREKEEDSSQLNMHNGGFSYMNSTFVLDFDLIYLDVKKKAYKNIRE